MKCLADFEIPCLRFSPFASISKLGCWDMAGGVNVLAVAPWFVRSRSRDFNGLPFVALVVGCCAIEDIWLRDAYFYIFLFFLFFLRPNGEVIVFTYEDMMPDICALNSPKK